MEITFTKMHGAGNDFIFIEDMNDRYSISTEEVNILCDRHFGIGADGIILVKPSKNPDCIAFMHYINADGSRAQMCGNGVRCFAKYLVDKRITCPDEDVFNVDTLSGPKPICVHRNDVGEVITATVDMGIPFFAPAAIPTTLPVTDENASYGPMVLEMPIDTPAGPLLFSCVSMGNPHAITFVEDPDTFDVEGIGAFMESHSAFPEKTNVEFAHIVEGEGEGEARIRMRVYERGVGETLACGTGSCATAVAAAVLGRAPREVVLDILGGELEICWNEDNHVLMTGPARSVFTGHIDIDSITKPGCNRRRC